MWPCRHCWPRARAGRDPHASSYLATFAPAAGFGVPMAAEARRRGAGHVRHLVVLGDGAAWIWNLAAARFPEATQIVDLFHAREHLHDLAKLQEFMLGDHREEWLDEPLAELDADDIGALRAAARAFPCPAARPPDGTRPWATSSTTPTACTYLVCPNRPPATRHIETTEPLATICGPIAPHRTR
jgi:hypothetical protein